MDTVQVQRLCEVCGRPLSGRKGKIFCGPKCKQKRFRALRSAVMGWVESVIVRSLDSCPLVVGQPGPQADTFPEE
jgi:hypothetical protein